jgi:hypothetical protein
VLTGDQAALVNLNQGSQIMKPLQDTDIKMCDCENWGENRRDEYYMDVGCVIGYSYCPCDKSCPNYRAIKKKVKT